MLILLPRHYYERAIAIRRTINPATSSTAGLKIDIGCLLMRKGDCRQSIAYFKEAIADFQSMPGPSAYANSEVIYNVFLYMLLFVCLFVCLVRMYASQEHPWLVHLKIK